ncbi:MGDG synthase family glycosyltransferase [Neobacillus vireti]|uniref:Monogalactosyldiacylglycerol (MGDG) synthase n=1 Tax=Neobacillus vireti LMG 21834 TaxID=1131730 RepID=A0AB94IFP1_9BACI|nr:monogalactosyldiacylglycerol (MGDG) synthase [Neobacillus vireti]ETI65929.1 monogalactosyldiacylglycerol (MGDG) synthase [Neobacillus vireti LMG 21834]KLT18303.1 galactosyldiacylglycerol synthase [Neobacillus vireti]
MKKILFLPLLQMQSGHHQVAEAIMDLLKNHTDDVIFKKIDLLSYTNKSLEKMITNGYLKWIRYAPESYNLAYKSFFYVPPAKGHSFKWYQPLFMKKMEQLLAEENPDLIVCTHAFPSNLLSKLKMKGKCDIPVINVYTDFFINSIWGREGIDAHFLPSQYVKEHLLKKYQIPTQRLLVTGIPVHERITKNDVWNKTNNLRPQILIAGGNSGLGGIAKLADELKRSTQIDYLVLCGKNRKLYEEVRSWNLAHIKPLPYLSSRTEMNNIYEAVDAIMTKPGGVTVSEALKKRLPIFVHSMLPGQEEINLHHLKDKELAFELEQKLPLEKQLLAVLQDAGKMKRWEQAVDAYQQGIELNHPESMVDAIKVILDQETSCIQAAVGSQQKVLQRAGA